MLTNNSIEVNKTSENPKSL